MEEKLRQLFHDAIDLRNEIFMKQAITGVQTESEKMIYEFLDKFGEDYIALTDELYVLKPFKIFIGRGDLNG